MRKKWSSKFEIKPGTWVFVPTAECVSAGRTIKAEVQRLWSPPNNYFHLRAGGHVEGLKAHVSNSIFVHLDIKDFFGSISKTRVTRVLRPLVGYAKAREWANFSTVSHDVAGKKTSILPFGFVQSPIIASLCLNKSALGSGLARAAAKGLTVSVYMDDIVLSANDSDLISSTVTELKRLAVISGFNLNPKKEEGPADRITAFNIELKSGSVEVTSDRLQQFASAINEGASEHSRRGVIGYVRTISNAQASELEGSS
jgi:hypothetical protein